MVDFVQLWRILDHYLSNKNVILRILRIIYCLKYVRCPPTGRVSGFTQGRTMLLAETMSSLCVFYYKGIMYVGKQYVCYNVCILPDELAILSELGDSVKDTHVVYM